MEYDIYHEAVDALNSGRQKRFPVRSEFYDEMDNIYDPTKPMYRDEFEKFLDETYGVDHDPFGREGFEW